MGAKKSVGISEIPQQPPNHATGDSGGHAKYEVHGFTDVGSTSSHTPTKSPRGGEMGNVGPTSSTAALTKGKDKGQKSWKRWERKWYYDGGGGS